MSLANSPVTELKEQILNIAGQLSRSKSQLSQEDCQVIEETIRRLDQGSIRVAQEIDSSWVTHAWIKEAILMYFKVCPMEEVSSGLFTFHDKIPIKKNVRELNIRVVPPAAIRYGSFLEPGAVVMPSYVNIGAWVGANSMIDTWATVGSCAQIGSGVHVSSGVVIGGVLEPANASPVIVGDGAFVGSGCQIVEGVRVGKEAVLAANLSITASTPVIDTRSEPFTVSKGVIPPRAVVLPGTREKELPGGKIYTNCAYIIGERQESTDRKTSLNHVLREFSISG